MKTFGYLIKLPLAVVFFSLLHHRCFAQVSISGVINNYTKVTAVNTGCNSVTVNSVAGFSAGARVLIIQMKGATIDVMNGPTYGNITAINNAGNYEIAEILGISGLEIYFKNTLLKSYTPAGLVQLVSIPQYSDVNIVGTLTAQPWNAASGTGGVLIFEASGTVTMNADINLSSLGFTGGAPSVNGGTCVFGSTPNYAYAATSSNGAIKGEGIVIAAAGSEGGRGKLANGGGGGNNHNNGGGGGANYGAGGQGDNRSSGCNSTYPSAPGIGGLALGPTFYSNTINKIFLGGGGGGGHQNNNLARAGGDGGGIVIIKASAINGNNHSIISQGDSVGYNEIDHGDGNGGGGAGGTVLLQVNNYTSPLNINVKGGAGGWTNGGGYPDRYFGPGGGGGGGVIWMSVDNPLVSKNFSGGNSGWSTTHNSPYGAVSGSPGALLTGLSIPESSTLFSPPCIVTPVSLLSFYAKNYGSKTKLIWTITDEDNNAFFTLERSTDMDNWQRIAYVPSVKSKSLYEYQYIDYQPLQGTSYYRLSQTDADGTHTTLAIAKTETHSVGNGIVKSIFPNPASDEINIHLAKETPAVHINIYNAAGIKVADTEYTTYETLLKINLSELQPGIYLMSVSDYNEIYYHTFVKE
ncbi:MAG: T9SS type A sorting domain-containing protein [Cytophagaceae bacterium]|nr:T9SS type A sorting domain-containing protein [Cytophagaceae bacterium]MDW8456874.1 T9SS type A sorting domain-containing protein [Cytophagaceae bacterium]